MDETKLTMNSLIFAVNGEKFLVPCIDHSTSLLEFLRCHTRFKGAKLCCGEGGCGACVVMLSKYDSEHGQSEDMTVSSCLTLLSSINGCSITTTEGLGNSKDGFHPIHQRLAGFHASQCGFCSPGISVSLFSALLNAEKTDRPEPLLGFSRLTITEAEKAILGNLCRCTGYRTIADACKSFASDVDIEDLGLNSFWSRRESRDVKIERLPFYDFRNGIHTLPDFLESEVKSKVILDSKKRCWCYPSSVKELHGILDGDSAMIKLIVGNTGTGYYKDEKSYDKYIDLKNIPELSMIINDYTGIEIGAAVSISKAILSLKSENNMIFRKIAKHMEVIASGFIRNSASVGGNLVMAQRNHFPSDIVTVFLAVDSMVNILTGSNSEKMFTMEEFLEMPPLDSYSILLSVKIRNWRLPISGKSETRLLFETYRAAPRPLGNALPYLNAAFLAEINEDNASNSICIENIRMAFGAYGTKHSIRAKKIEKFLVGKLLSTDVLYEASELIKAVVVPEDGTFNAAYRSSLAVGFIFQFFSPFIEYSSFLKPEMSNSFKDFKKKPALLSSGRQVLEFSEEYLPVGEAIAKSGAAQQASGEAVFVDDISSPPHCLYGAFIYSIMPCAQVKGIHFKSNSVPDGFSASVSFKDIPVGGKNVGSLTIFGTEKLFADDITDCAGQRIAFVVADTQKHADMAASSAEVDYTMGALKQPILTVDTAVEMCSFFEVPSFVYPKTVGDFAKGMDEADHKIVSAEIGLGSQYYFYMETQTALAVPDEDNCLVVYSSCQCPENAHKTIASCIGVPEHNVRVISRRVGGGFGGKAIKAIPVATACALAAHKLRRPVRTYLNRKSDMITAGGRHPMKITYSVGFMSSGKVTALHVDLLIDAGIFVDISPILPHNIVGALKKYDWGALSFDIKVCRTNHTSRSAMRAPGEVQGTFICEAVIEHVASTVSLEADSVREINLHTFETLSLFYGDSAGAPHEYSLPSIWDKLACSSSMNERIVTIKQFNMRNQWKKRGISRVPIVHEVQLRATPGKVSILSDGSVVVEVGGIELGQGIWTKVKQMAAFALSSIKCDGTENLLNRVRVIQSDTLSLIQGGFTSGSTTSESSCEAVRLCCNTLVERLMPLLGRMNQQRSSIRWDTLISEAHFCSINLSASSYFVPEYASMQYLNYGAAVSEVEVNLLTGETTILQADIIYDGGQSLNPAIDLGQIEGAFVQGIGFFMFEEYLTNSDGLVITNDTWTYKIPTLDTIPKQFNVEIMNSGRHQHRVLSSKASGEPPLLLAVSVHCATRAAIREARRESLGDSGSIFQLEVPATMPVVKRLCGFDNVQRHFYIFE